MPLYYALVENHVTPDPNDRSAMALPNQSFTLEDVFDRMTSRGSTVTKAEGLSVMEELTHAIEQLVKDGNSVNTPLFNIQPSIVGVFTSDDDGFDYSRHQVKLRINPGKRLREMESAIPVEKTTLDKKLPLLAHFYDIKTESADVVISAGGGARITGGLLKFDEKDNNQGVFFVNQADGVAARAAGKFLRNKPGELIFIVPELVAGTYKVEVRSVFRVGQPLRVGVLPYELTVA
ncbi:MAG: DUF4469 domain-containing protein [Chitinophagaceae bacterium]|nr:DUF4469 domain-containing protein [Chitinophagaceae bacterium]